MDLNPVLQRFVEQAPLSVLARSLLERAVEPAALDELFHDHAREQRTRQLLFSNVVDTLALVVFRCKRSVAAAYHDRRDRLGVTRAALYAKLAGVEPAVCRALVRHTAERLAPVLDALDPHRRALLPGYAVRILDGNDLTGTDHRLRVLRGTRSAALPGQSLAVLDPDRGLIVDLFPCLDAYTQERALLGPVLETVQAGQLWIGDRNFCTTGFVFGVAAQGGTVLVRRHQQTLTWDVETPWADAGPCPGGRLQEQTLDLTNADDPTAPPVPVRHIRVPLAVATQDGDDVVELLTTLPTTVPAATVADLYLGRRRIEDAFQVLTDSLRCEVNTLGYPQAALLGFAVAVCGYNVVAAVRGALAAAHGAAALERVSTYYLIEDWSATTRGLDIAGTPAEWAGLGGLDLGEFVAWVRGLAQRVRLSRYPKSPRGPKKPPPKKTSGKARPHVATARLLKETKRRNP